MSRIPTHAVVYLGNDNRHRVRGLRDADSGTYDNSAVVQAWVEDQVGSVIGSPIAMPYVPGSDGDYRGNFDETFAWPQGVFYLVTEAVSGSGVARWRQPTKAVHRRE